MATSNQFEDNYLKCEAYQGHAESPQKGFLIFTNPDNGEHYFSMIDHQGNVYFRSEGYTNVPARDNGIKSVLTNREKKERYSIIEANGKHYVTLKAGNHQEIARSCGYESLQALYGFFPFLAEGSNLDYTWNLPVVAAANSLVADNLNIADKDREEDNYLGCDAYAGKSDSASSDIRTFQSTTDNEYYFSVVNNNEKVLLRSEGYPSLAARDNGIKSVESNRVIKERYSFLERKGVHYVILKAGNHQEIARSCGAKSKDELFALFPLLAPIVEKPAEVITPIIAAATTVAAAATSFAANSKDVETPKAAAYVAPKKEVEVPKAAYVAPEIEEVAAGGLPKWLLPLLGLLLLGALAWWLMKGCEKPAVNTDNTSIETSASNVSTPDTMTPPPPPVAASQTLEEFSPVVLYFDNDQPNKNSTASTTLLSYGKTYNSYIAQKSNFAIQQDSDDQKNSIKGFFENEVKKGYDDLKSLSEKLSEKLKAGKSVELTVKGFASPLAANDYNTNLTKRRINSILNELGSKNGGNLKQYVESGKIKITEEANGENASATGISDDDKNTKLSIYDLAPSKERRVEIIGVKIID
ncbi:MAG: YegP family protein [Pseudarcicella sp.]|nr:YegP family protein [Pseudarcicella sp.]MBP6411334.1 YegP family protein [Pseudarcicella sp.]